MLEVEINFSQNLLFRTLRKDISVGILSISLIFSGMLTYKIIFGMSIELFCRFHMEKVIRNIIGSRICEKKLRTNHYTADLFPPFSLVG